MNINQTGTLRFLNGMSAEFYHITNDNPIPSISPNLHNHDCYELYFFVSGSGDFYVEDTFYTMEYGDIVITRPNELHNIYFTGNSFYEHYFFYIDPKSFAALDPTAEDPLTCFKKRQTGRRNVIKLSAKATDELFFYLKTLKSRLNDDSLSDSLSNFSYFMRILAITNEGFRCGQNEHNRTGSNKTVYQQSFTDLLEYVNSNYKTLDGLDEISDALHFSKAHISRLFKRYMHINLMEYVRAKKIALAKDLLASGMNVTDAGLEAGFNNYTYFITAFREATGTTPNKYKKEQ